MKCLVVFILFVVGLVCGANRLKCQIFNQIAKSLEQYCDNFIGFVPVSCIREIYPIEPSNVEILKTRGCDPDLVLNTAKPLKNLRVLDISHSGYKNLDWMNVTFNRLQIFNASHNELYTSYCSFGPEIVEIDLSYNYLNEDSLPDFVGLDKLRKLHLSNNSIKYQLHEENFDASNLEYIDLRNNRLFYMPILATSNKLEEIHLEGNPILSFSCSGIGRPSLKAVYFSWNTVNYFGDSTNRCEEARMRIVQYSTHEGVLIPEIGSYEIHCKNECFQHIFILRAGRNTFENITEVLQVIPSDIIGLDLNKSFLGEMRSNLFERFPTLFDLNLSETELDGNHVERLNKIIGHLSHMHLRALDVSGNMVGELKVTTFQRLTKLRRLNMRNTNLILPNTNPFETLTDLESLDLSQNNLAVTFSIMSDNLYKLEELRMSDCRIKHISEVIQYLGPSIRKLDLSDNFDNVEQTFHRQTFERLKNLENLNLSNTNLLSVDSDLFKNLPNLHILDLSLNKLKTFDLQVLANCSVYRLQLNLEMNELTEIKYFPEIHFRIFCLYLANNQISCPHLKQISHARSIVLLDDSWQQKDGTDCRSTTQSISNFLSNVYEKVKFW